MQVSRRLSRTGQIRLSRLLVAAVFTANLSAAIPFTINPARFTSGFELSGITGAVFVRSLGILFLMWNATYPPVIWRPQRYRLLFVIILFQQVIGLVGELIMFWTLPAGHEALRATATRFITFDGLGLFALLLAYTLSRPTIESEE